MSSAQPTAFTTNCNCCGSDRGYPR